MVVRVDDGGNVVLQEESPTLSAHGSGISGRSAKRFVTSESLEDGLLPAAEDETTGDEETTGEDETTDGCGATLTGALWDGVTTPEEETGVLE